MGIVKKRGHTSDVRLIADIQKFLLQCLMSEKDESETFSMLRVHHLVSGNKKGEEVANFKIADGFSDDHAEALAAEILTRIQLETNALGGWQKYALYAYTDAETDSHFGRHLVKLQSSDSDNDPSDDLDSEGPSAKGMAHQQMRHNEALVKTMIGSQAGTLGALNSIIARQAEMIDGMLGGQVEMLNALREMSVNRHQQELELAEAAEKAETKRVVTKQALSKLGVLMPMLLNKFAGTNLPVEGAGIMMQARALFSAVTADPKKVEALANILEPEQMASFLNLYDEISKATHGTDDDSVEN